MTAWTLGWAAAILLLIGVVTLRRRLGRTRYVVSAFRRTQTTGAAGSEADEAGSAGAALDLGAEVLEHLRRLEAKGSPGLATQVLEIFLQDMSARLQTLREAVARRDGEATYRVAHTLQGSASMVGAVPVARSCAELVKAAQSESFDRCEAIVAELEAGFEAIQRVVID